MTECEHDWRIVPNVILPSNPPQMKIICILCNRVTSSGIKRRGDSPVPGDRTTWRKFEGEVKL